MDIITQATSCWKISGALETQSLGQNVGQAGAIACENSVDKQSSLKFLLPPVWNLLHTKYDPGWKSHKSVSLPCLGETRAE